MSTVNKKITLELVGLDGNAFFLMSAFANQARREKWTKEEIDSVLKECQSGDYNHLLCTLMEHCESPDENDHEDEDECDCEGDEECCCCSCDR